MEEGLQIDKRVDLNGEVCPFPWVKSKKALAKMGVGQILKVIVDHAPASKNIPHYFEEEGQRILSVDKINDLDWQIIVKKEK